MRGKEVAEKFQYRKVIGLEYSLGLGEMKIDIEGTDNNYFTKLDEVQIDTKKLELEAVEINNKKIFMKFSEPINCNVDSGRYSSTMVCGTNLEGDNKKEFIERLDGLADRLGFNKNKGEDK